ncbi:unnamed protein product [Menidia menidia]|uniref:(Atlantic silverside) hypothetical protein n=1 Tax=Menidia menidia TaxID=238744 RepID=A0A8S4AJP4_9TELE|nr:unnamed protein product [Menidia menidia]
METTTVLAVIIIMVTTRVLAVTITMETNTMKLTSITMESTTVLTITMTTALAATVTINTTTVLALTNITMETTTVLVTAISRETKRKRHIPMDTILILTIVTKESTRAVAATISVETMKIFTITMEVLTKAMPLNLTHISRRAKTPISSRMASTKAMLTSQRVLPAVHFHKESRSLFSATQTTRPVKMRSRQVLPGKTDELGKIMMLQNQNEGLHQSLLQTAVRMECLGEEFISSQKVLETELHKTRMELSNLMDRFRRLQDNCSSAQHSNNILEQKLHSVAQNMEGERERLNRRISELTVQLTGKGTGALTTVTSIPPPPAQFMDSQEYGKAKAVQELSLGSVPEEEESDWSEIGEETPRLILMGSNRAWRHQEADVDKDSESGGEDGVRRHSPRPLQIPKLQFTIHNDFFPPQHANSCSSGFKNLSNVIPDDESYRMATSQNFKSTILIRSASLEEIPLACHPVQKELRGTEAMMNLHHSEEEIIEDLHNEIIHHWRISNDRDTVRSVTESRGPEADGSLASLHSAERMLNHLICDPQFSEQSEPGRAEVQEWARGIPEEVLKGERTKL